MSTTDQSKEDELANLEERKSKNLLLIGCISIVMVFAGFTSAYLVVKKDNFWVEVEQPVWFMISTVIILISSLTFYLALRAAKNDNQKGIKLFMIATVLGGIGFTYSQFMGWSELTSKGYNFINKIIAENRYGERVNYLKDGVKFGYSEDGKFLFQNEPVSDETQKDLDAYSEFLSDIDNIQSSEFAKLHEKYGFSIFEDTLNAYRPVVYKNGQFYNERDSAGHTILDRLSIAQRLEVKKCAQNIVNKVGTFRIKGEYGKDFRILYRDVPLEFKNGVFYANGKRLSQQELGNLESTKNTASSFIYILSGMHLLHLLGGLIYMLVVLNGSLREKYNHHNHLKIKLGSLYWHFLGGLWIYLYLFLTFIH